MNTTQVYAQRARAVLHAARATDALPFDVWNLSRLYSLSDLAYRLDVLATRADRGRGSTALLQAQADAHATAAIANRADALFRVRAALHMGAITATEAECRIRALTGSRQVAA